MPGRLEAIWIKRAHRGPMDPAASAELVAGKGMAGNADQGRRRQVTLIEREGWDRLMAAIGASLDPSVRRANLMVSDISLARTRGQVLRIGPCLLRVLGETRPCERMDEACEGLRHAMGQDWLGGVFGQIIEGGRISVGDPVSWDSQRPGIDAAGER